MKKNTLSIGFIDMLTGFLISSIILMLIIAFNMPTAANLAGYPQSFVQIDLLLPGTTGDLKIREGARFNFRLDTPDKETFFNAINNAAHVNNHNSFLELTDRTGTTPANMVLWGPMRKLDPLSDTVCYTFYGAVENTDLEGWNLAIRYFDNTSLSDIRFRATQEVPMDTIMNQKLKMLVRWSFLQGKASVDTVNIGLGDLHQFKPRSQ